MTQSSCIHQHHRGKKSNYLYHTKHNIAELTQCHQKHKYAKRISFLYNTAFKLLTCPTQQPFAGLISLKNTKSQKEILLMKEQTAHLLAGAQNWEFQLLTKTKNTVSKQSHQRDHFRPLKVLFHWSFHLPVSSQVTPTSKFKS